MPASAAKKRIKNKQKRINFKPKTELNFGLIENDEILAIV